jgi:hypothetical protein
VSTDKVRENRVRRWAKRLDHRLIHSKAKRLHMNDRGLYQLVNGHNLVVEGASFDADLDRIEGYLGRLEAELTN